MHAFYPWRRDVPFMVRAMVVAGERMFLAGPRGNWLHSPEDFRGEHGVDFWSVSTADGETPRLAGTGVPAGF